MLIDTHSHIYDEAFDEDRDEVIRRAMDNGVGKIVLPAIDGESYESLFRTVLRYPDICYPLMGLHPTSVNDNPRFREELDMVEKYLSSPPEGIDRFCGVGEIGLDLYWSQQWIEEQKEAFSSQIELALKYDLPIVVHTRNAWREMEDVLKAYKGRGLRGIMHSYSGEYGEYTAIKECGDFLFGIGGVVTYKNSGIAETLPRMSVEDIVLETDSPYLPPVPYRGKRNESGYLMLICQKIAEIYGVGRGEIARITTDNALRMFGI